MISHSNLRRPNRYVQGYLRTNFTITMTNEGVQRTVRPRVFDQGKAIRYSNAYVTTTRGATMRQKQDRYYARRHYTTPYNGTNVRGEYQIRARRLRFGLSTTHNGLDSGITIMSFNNANSILCDGVGLRRLYVCFNVQIHFRPILREYLCNPRQARRNEKQLLRGRDAILCVRQFKRFRYKSDIFERGANLYQIYSVNLTTIPKYGLCTNFPNFRRNFIYFNRDNLWDAFTLTRYTFYLNRTTFAGTYEVRYSNSIKRVVYFVSRGRPITKEVGRPLRIRRQVRRMVMVPGSRVTPLTRI